MQHIERLSRATCVKCHVGTNGQLSYKVWQSLNRIYLSFILLAQPLTGEGREETAVPGENPWRRASERSINSMSRSFATMQRQWGSGLRQIIPSPEGGALATFLSWSQTHTTRSRPRLWLLSIHLRCDGRKETRKKKKRKERKRKEKTRSPYRRRWVASEIQTGKSWNGTNSSR